MHKWYRLTVKETRNLVSNHFYSNSVSVESYFFYAALALIIVFAWMEPAAAAGIGFAKGLLFWTIQIAILIPLLIVTQHHVSHIFSFRHPQSHWMQTILSGFLGGLIFVPTAYSLDILFSIPDSATELGIIHGLIDEASGVIVPVTVTWVALNVPWILQMDFSNKQYTAPDQIIKERSDNQELIVKDKEDSSQFLRELSYRTSGEIISISSELHYLRVFTTEKEVMFLYNLKDAIKEIPIELGVQIHRSHWVSLKHLIHLTKKNGSVECVLSNGKRLPVSRRKYSDIKKIIAPKV